MHQGGIRGGPQLGQDAGLLSHQAEAGQGMQMKTVVRTAEQEKEVRCPTIRGAEGNLLNRPAQDDERGFEHVGVWKAGMEQRQAARKAGRAKRFARLKTGQEALRIPEAARFLPSAVIWRKTEALVLAGRAGSMNLGSINSGMMASRARNRRVSLELFWWYSSRGWPSRPRIR